MTAITSEMPVFSPWPRTGPFQVLAWISPLILISPEKTFLGRCEGRKRESRVLSGSEGFPSSPFYCDGHVVSPIAQASLELTVHPASAFQVLGPQVSTAIPGSLFI